MKPSEKPHESPNYKKPKRRKPRRLLRASPGWGRTRRTGTCKKQPLKLGCRGGTRTSPSLYAAKAKPLYKENSQYQ